MKFLLALILSVSAISTQAQETEKSLPSFNKIVVSPRISLVLIKGDKESIRLLCNKQNVYCRKISLNENDV